MRINNLLKGAFVLLLTCPTDHDKIYSTDFILQGDGCNMEDIRKIVAANIAALRKNAGYTQLTLAEKLQYSDKAVSKWESGASMPDAGVLLAIASLFGVTVDYLLQEDHTEADVPSAVSSGKKHKHRIIALLSVALVWLIATAVFVFLTFSPVQGPLWLSFVWAVPVSFVVAIVFNSVWGIHRRNYLYISLLMWTLLGAVYLTCLPQNLWLLFVIGVPGQIIILLWAGMQKKPKNP